MMIKWKMMCALGVKTRVLDFRVTEGGGPAL